MSVVEVEGHTLKLSNLDKILYPETGFTKAEVIDYYARIAPTILPHCSTRFVTRKRYPNGVDSQPFFEKNCPSHKPEWMSTNDMPSSDGEVRFCAVDSTAAVIWCANLAALELHTSMAHAKDESTPSMVVFDLDPGAPADIVDCCDVGLMLKEIFDDLGVEAFPKTSGSKGLQVYLPLNTKATHEGASAFSKSLAQQLERDHPDRAVSLQRKDLRVGKVLIDWSQNARTKTTVCVYSLRARAHPTVSTPVTWDEVAAVAESRDGSRLVFETADVLERVASLGDLFAATLTLKQKLPKV